MASSNKSDNNNNKNSATKRSIVISERDNIAVLMEGEKALEFIINRAEMLLGDVYLAEVENILPSIDAAFVNVGGDKMGFLHSSDVEGKGDLKTRIKPKQKLIVQVMKEPTGHKGPRVTTNISLPGRFLVLIPESRGISISRKIESATERARLKSIVNVMKPAGIGVIIRTEAQGQSDAEIQEDFEVLLERWQNIVSMADTAKPPAMLYRDQDLLYRVIREMVTEEVTEITVDTPFGQQRAQQLLQNWNLDKGLKVSQYSGPNSIMVAKGVERELRQALMTKVPLPSGGYLYIQQTEALTVIDVNSGKFTSLQSQADTIRITNLESCKEIARQLRLRNIGGMVIVDFIDMESRADQLAVLQAFENDLLPDKAKPQVGQLTDLGLVEMTRHRQGQSLKEIFAKTCPTCNGVGHVANEFAWASLGQEQRAAQDARYGPGGRGKPPSLRNRLPHKSDSSSSRSHDSRGTEEKKEGFSGGVIRSVGTKPKADRDENDKRDSRDERDNRDSRDDRNRQDNRDRNANRDRDRDNRDSRRDRFGDRRFENRDKTQEARKTLKVLMPGELAERPKAPSLLDKKEDKPAWLAYYTGQPLPQYYQDLLLQTAGLELAHEVKVGVTPQHANNILARIRPGANDVFRLVELMEGTDHFAQDANDNDDDDDEGYDENDSDDSSASSDSDDKASSDTRSADDDESDEADDVTQETTSSDSDDEEGYSSKAEDSDDDSDDSDDDDVRNEADDDSDEDDEDDKPSQPAKKKAPVRRRAAAKPKAQADDEDDDEEDDDDTSSKGGKGKADNDKPARRKRSQPRKLSKKVAKVSTKPKGEDDNEADSPKKAANPA